MVAESFRQDQRARPERLDGHLAGDPLVQLDCVVDVDAADARVEERLQRQAVAPVLDGHDNPRRAHPRDDVVELVARAEPSAGERRPRVRWLAVDDAEDDVVRRIEGFDLLDQSAAMGPAPRIRRLACITGSLAFDRSARPGSPRRTCPGSTRGSTGRNSRTAAGHLC